MKAIVIALVSLLLLTSLSTGAGALSVTPAPVPSQVRDPDVLGIILAGFGQLADAAARGIVEPARGVLSWFIGLFTWNAQAACGSGGGTCYWVGGTGNTGQTAHWSATSGGASCACVPANSDNVIWNAASGAGTSTILGGFITNNVNMTGSSVTVSSNAGTWAVSGDFWDDGSAFLANGGTVNIYSASTVHINEARGWHNLGLYALGGVQRTFVLYTRMQQLANGTFTFDVLTTINTALTGVQSPYQIQVQNNWNVGASTIFNVPIYLYAGAYNIPANLHYRSICINTGSAITMPGDVAILGTSTTNNNDCAGNVRSLGILSGYLQTNNHKLIVSGSSGLSVDGAAASFRAGTSMVILSRFYVNGSGAYVTSSYAYPGVQLYQWYVNGSWYDSSTSSDASWSNSALVYLGAPKNASTHYSFGSNHHAFLTGPTIFGTCAFRPANYSFCETWHSTGDRFYYGPYYGSRVYFDTDLILKGTLTTVTNWTNPAWTGDARGFLVIYTQGHTVRANEDTASAVTYAKGGVLVQQGSSFYFTTSKLYLGYFSGSGLDDIAVRWNSSSVWLSSDQHSSSIYYSSLYVPGWANPGYPFNAVYPWAMHNVYVNTSASWSHEEIVYVENLTVNGTLWGGDLGGQGLYVVSKSLHIGASGDLTRAAIWARAISIPGGTYGSLCMDGNSVLAGNVVVDSSAIVPGSFLGNPNLCGSNDGIDNLWNYYGNNACWPHYTFMVPWRAMDCYYQSSGGWMNATLYTSGRNITVRDTRYSTRIEGFLSLDGSSWIDAFQDLKGNIPETMPAPPGWHRPLIQPIHGSGTVILETGVTWSEGTDKTVSASIVGSVILGDNLVVGMVTIPTIYGLTATGYSLTFKWLSSNGTYVWGAYSASGFFISSKTNRFTLKNWTAFSADTSHLSLVGNDSLANDNVSFFVWTVGARIGFRWYVDGNLSASSDTAGSVAVLVWNHWSTHTISLDSGASEILTTGWQALELMAFILALGFVVIAAFWLRKRRGGGA